MMDGGASEEGRAGGRAELLSESSSEGGSDQEEVGPLSRGLRSFVPSFAFGALGVACVALVVVSLAFRSFGTAPPQRASSPGLDGVGGAKVGRDLAGVNVPTAGVVSAIYTYGAPATADPPLENLLASNGCFDGLRCYNEDIVGPATRQVDAAAMSNVYPHAKMPTVVLHLGVDSEYFPCPGKPTWPNDKSGEVFAEWRLHWENDYTPRLQNITVNHTNMSSMEPFATALKFVLLAYKSYDSTANTIEAIANRLPGWKLVARETRIQGESTLYDEDPIMLVQNGETLDCALVFTGTNNVDNEVMTSTTSFGSGYCGFTNVHDGYRNELWDITKTLFPKLRPKLEKCNKVACVGHSLGGSLCEIFAACANSKRVSDPDYQQQMWARDKPQAMSQITVGKVFYVGDAEHRCPEPPCPKTPGG